MWAQGEVSFLSHKVSKALKMGQGASKEPNELENVVVNDTNIDKMAREGDFSVRYMGDGLEDILKAGPEAKQVLQGKMQEAYEAGMRDSSSDNEAAMAQYRLSIIGEFQRELEAMQKTHAGTAKSLSQHVQEKLKVQTVARERCVVEESSVMECYKSKKGDPLACADFVN